MSITKDLIKQKNQTKKILSKAKTEKPILVEKGLVDFLNEIKKGEITIEQAKDSQEDFNKYLKTIRSGNKTKK